MTTRNTGGATRERTSISLPADLLQRARQAGGDNLSAFVERAVRETLMSDAMLEVARLHGRDAMDDVFDAAEADAEAAA